MSLLLQLTQQNKIRKKEMRESQVLDRSKAASWFTSSSQFTHSDLTPPPKWCQESAQNTWTSYIVGIILFNKFFFLWQQCKQNSHSTARGNYSKKKKNTCNLTSRTDCYPSTGIAANTRIINLLASFKRYSCRYTSLIFQSFWTARLWSITLKTVALYELKYCRHSSKALFSIPCSK